MGPKEIREHCRLGPSAQNLLKAATPQLKLSARGYHRVLELARTISHLAEPVQYPLRGRA